jgi:hypothetical protein
MWRNKMIEVLKSVKVMFDDFEDLSLGFVPRQIEEIENKVSELENLDPRGKEAEIKSILSPDEAHAVVKAYCFTKAHRQNRFTFLRK